uniref:Pyrin domain-containing protein n=1 Tax=Amphiprion percula TaxID=161767 RepID=A0A3P8SUU4_AMPPE
MTSEVLFNILDDLDDDQLSKFQWFLQKPNNVQGLPAITKSRLQTLDRCKTVDVIVETYGLQRAVQVTRVVLEKISRNDLLQRTENLPPFRLSLLFLRLKVKLMDSWSVKKDGSSSSCLKWKLSSSRLFCTTQNSG